MPRSSNGRVCRDKQTPARATADRPGAEPGRALCEERARGNPQRRNRPVTARNPDRSRNSTAGLFFERNSRNAWDLFPSGERTSISCQSSVTQGLAAAICGSSDLDKSPVKFRCSPSNDSAARRSKRKREILFPTTSKFSGLGGLSRGDAIMKRLAILHWYRVLRVHHHWTVFQAVRFALWLAR